MSTFTEVIAKAREDIVKKTGRAPTGFLCGRAFLLSLLRNKGRTGTDDELVAPFADRLTPDGYYRLGDIAV